MAALRRTDDPSEATHGFTAEGICVDGTAQRRFLAEAQQGNLPPGTVACTDAKGRFPTGMFVGASKVTPVSVQSVDGGRAIRFDWPHMPAAWLEVPMSAINRAISDADAAFEHSVEEQVDLLREDDGDVKI